MKKPVIHVGIMTASKIDFVLAGDFIMGGEKWSGRQSVSFFNGHILWKDKSYRELQFVPLDSETGCFELQNVTIGIQFHWERKENQRFKGALKFITDDANQIIAVNLIPIESYLVSVISSEMNANASLQLLKAHAVISRSWVLSNIDPKKRKKEASTVIQGDHEYIRWYDHQAHTYFDVCADDHCQRYEGITRASTPTVRRAVKETEGEVLVYEGKICDARFSKCCGGAFEEFQNCWEHEYHPYLKKKRDIIPTEALPDLTREDEADKWIRSVPVAFCQTDNKKILSQVLNNYDQETTDFYRWKVEYTQKELTSIIREKSGLDFGEILNLVPVERGTSGRIVRLKFVGTKKTLVIGKELEIRRLLSRTHLYSSAFVVDKLDVDEHHIPGKFVLTGAGWGHGVGLCQIGAAVMGAKGFLYDEILHHYFKDAQIEKRYEDEQ